MVEMVCASIRDWSLRFTSISGDVDMDLGSGASYYFVFFSCFVYCNLRVSCLVTSMLAVLCAVALVFHSVVRSCLSLFVLSIGFIGPLLHSFVATLNPTYYQQVFFISIGGRG